MDPEVWAPAAGTVDLVLGDGSRIPLTRNEDGWWRGGPQLAPGDRYGFALDGGDPLPDPRSRWQPDGIHALSAVDDPDAHAWQDGAWPGLDLAGGVLYELHIGTFTPEGTFDGAIERLDHLVALGVAAVELMPVAEAMGRRGWGYDGVLLWAAHHAYGGPAGLRRFVDAAHQRGLGVLLDVVYNHLGPEGNHLARFGPYFTDRHETPWGPAVNLDGPDAGEVRRWIVDNAVHWCEAFHLDGLRLDATHALLDDSPVHVVAELTEALEELSARTGRRRWVFVEREQPEPLPILPRARGGWGADGRWADDLHHALHAVLTGERDGYYRSFGSLRDVQAALEDGPPAALVTCLQNHDQIGNRALGERITHLVDLDRALAAAALVLLGPGTPLLFQGEEWAASTPFPYVADTDDDELAARIRDGRLEEFAAFGWDPAAIPDPLDPATAASAVLSWDEAERPPHARALGWYRRLIHLRRELFGQADEGSPVSVEVDEDLQLVRLRRGDVLVTACLREGGVEVTRGGVPLPLG